MEEKKNNKKNYILIIGGIIAAIMLTFGITYAYWRLTKEQTNENVVTTACLDFEITNEQDDINLPKAYPISDYEGYELTPYKFTIHNKCEDNASYQINLEMLEGSNLSTNFIKYILNELTEKYVIEYEDDYDSYKYVYDTNEECQSELGYYQNTDYYTVTKECVKEKKEPNYWYPSILGEEDVEEEFVLDDTIEGRKLMTGILTPEESKDFTLRLWMDEDVKVEDDAMNKTLLSKITVSTTYLSAEDAVRPTADLVLSLCNDSIIASGSGFAKNDREISKYEYKIDEGNWQEGEAYYEFTGQNLGNHQVSVRVTDNQNSVSKEVTKEIEMVEAESKSVDIYGMQIPIASCKNGLYEVAHNTTGIDSEWNKTEYRFAGENPNNYVEFNGEKWRIIGLVNVKVPSDNENIKIEQRLKIIRTDEIENQKKFGNFVWDNIDDNRWTTSKLKNMLNGIYYNSENGECYTVGDNYNMLQGECDFSGNGILPKGLSSVQNMIDSEVIWNTNSTKGDNIIENIYERERSTNKTYVSDVIEWTMENDEEYHKGVGLMYPSDYGYATSGGILGRNKCFVAYLENPFYETEGDIIYNWKETEYNLECAGKDWLKPIGNDYWTISPYNSDSFLISSILSDGTMSSGVMADSFNLTVEPVIYLKNTVTIIGGTGEIETPYTLRVN